MSTEVANNKHNKVDRNSYQRDHGIGQKIKSRKRRVDQKHRVYVVCRGLGNKSAEHEIAIAADQRHHDDGNHDVFNVSYYVDFYVSKDRKQKKIKKYRGQKNGVQFQRHREKMAKILGRE